MASSEHVVPGRAVTIELRRGVVTGVLFAVTIGLLLGGLFLIQIPDTYSRHAAAQFAGWLSFPTGIYVGLLAVRVATWSRLYVKLTRTRLEFPSLHGLTARQVELDLADLEDVGFVTTRGTSSSAVWSGGKRHQVAIPFWLPKTWTTDELTRRISLRWAATKRGLGGPELAAVEAAWDDDDAAGIAVKRKGKKWKLVDSVEDVDDYERRRDAGELGKEPELILADDVMPDWREIRDAMFLPKPKQKSRWFG